MVFFSLVSFCFGDYYLSFYSVLCISNKSTERTVEINHVNNVKVCFQRYCEFTSRSFLTVTLSLLSKKSPNDNFKRFVSNTSSLICNVSLTVEVFLSLYFFLYLQKHHPTLSPFMFIYVCGFTPCNSNPKSVRVLQRMCISHVAVRREWNQSFNIKRLYLYS